MKKRTKSKSNLHFIVSVSIVILIGMACLHIAYLTGRLDMAKCLLDNQTNPDVCL